MKNVFRKWMLGVLKFLAKIKLKKMHCKVIGVTGSVGKTTCKDAIYDILKSKFNVYKSEKSYNSEFGVPLTILHQQSGFSSLLSWIVILVQGFLRTFFVRDKYDYLILEMGVDRKGDMDFLMKIARPDFAVMTAIKAVHIDKGQFDTIQGIFEEKRKIFDRLNEGGIALINIDDEIISKIYKKGDRHQLSYSQEKEADLSVKNFTRTEKGIEFDVMIKGESSHFAVPIFGKYQLTNILPAIGIGVLTGVSAEEMKGALAQFKLPPGRMNIIEGLKSSLILDSSYNASPEAVLEALKILDFFGKKRQQRRVFVFGNMNELGNRSKEFHKSVGEKIPQHTDVLITVGPDVKISAESAIHNGLSKEKVKSFDSAHDAAEYYKTIMNDRDVILVKGSQNNVRLEFFIKEVMADPEKAAEKLVRQDKNWENIM